QASRELVPGVALGRVRGKGPHGVERGLPELLRGHRRARVADQREPLRQPPLQPQVPERGQQLAPGQIPRRAEDHGRLREDLLGHHLPPSDGGPTSIHSSVTRTAYTGTGSTAGPPTGSPVARSNSLWWQGHTTVSSWSPSVPSASEHPSWGHSSPNANSSFSTCGTAPRGPGGAKERSPPPGPSASDPTRRYISSTRASSLKER